MINNNLEFCRESLDMTQEELGFVFGVHKSTISCWENNHSTIPFKKLIKFCNLYDYSLDFVCGLSRTNKGFTKIVLDKKKIGTNLKNARKRLKLTQQQIADECSISQTTYNTYEKGKYLVSTLTIYTICKNHQISMDTIVH